MTFRIAAFQRRRAFRSDTIQEFRVLNQSYDAAMGATRAPHQCDYKGGTNAFHGSLLNFSVTNSSMPMTSS